MRFLQAEKIFNYDTFLPPNQVLVLDDKNAFVEFISENQVDNSKIQKLEGLLTPGFVNAHCHLELSHLKGKIAQHTGVPKFAEQVIALRSQLRTEEIAEHMQEADKNMWESGMVAVGDISNDAASFETKASSKLKYHTFIELIGLKPESAQSIFEKGKELHALLKEYSLIGSLAPHAPYSSSKELIQLISEFNLQNHFPFSIHNQESKEEDKFYHGKENGFNDLYKFLNLDLSWFKTPNTSSLKYYAEALHAKPSILVHNTFSAQEDINSVNSKAIFWCFCPAANVYIENQLPDYSLFKDDIASLCLGTDSLASNHTLDLISEANLILKNSSPFSLESMLQMMTSSGATALNLQEQFGQFIPGKNTGINQLQISNNSLTLIKKIA
jgi:cytosine/adenosine deaminase-related metal-dependent hydrolase